MHGNGFHEGLIILRSRGCVNASIKSKLTPDDLIHSQDNAADWEEDCAAGDHEGYDAADSDEGEDSCYAHKGSTIPGTAFFVHRKAFTITLASFSGPLE